MYDSATGGLCRNWREGKGPQGVADDYAFLIQGMSCLDFPPRGTDAHLLQAYWTSTRRANKSSTSCLRRTRTSSFG